MTHKRIRLAAETYADTTAICSITIAVEQRRRVFAKPALAQEAMRVLQEHAQKTGVHLFCFCVMPDHIHIILSPSDRCDVVTFVGQFKSLTLRAAWSHGVRGTFWQKSFWDHFIRDERGLYSAIEYVMMNPIRAGIVTDGVPYPYAQIVSSAPAMPAKAA